MRNRWFALVCIGAMLVFGALVYGRLPDQVPVHWGIDGQPDRWGSRLEAVLLLPAISAGLWLLLLILPRIDPRRASYAAFEGTFYLFINAVVLFLSVMYVVTMGIALGWHIAVPQVIGACVGMLLMVLGNELGRVQPNWFVGIRTPWTLSDPEIWRRTHRVGGRVFFVAGLAILVAALLLPPAYSFALILLGALGGAGFSAVYSYVVWRQRVTY